MNKLIYAIALPAIAALAASQLTAFSVKEELVVLVEKDQELAQTEEHKKSQFVEQAKIDAWFEEKKQPAQPPALPQSLLNSVLPQLPQVDHNDQLIINIQLKNFYEFYLSAVGEISIEQVILLCQQHLQQLPGAAAQQAIEIFKNYVSSINATAELKNKHHEQYTGDQKGYQQLQILAQAVIDTRQLYLSPEVYHAFYGNQDAYDRLMLSKMKITQNTDLSPAEKRAMIEQEVQNSPEWLKHSENKSNVLNKKAINRDNLDAQQTARLAQLDQKRNSWETRVNDYRREQQRLINHPDYNEADKKHLISDLRKQYFEGGELLRIANLDKIHSE